MEEKKMKLARINRYHMTYFAYLLKRMSETKDGDASLLDRSFVLRGSAFGDPNEHDFRPAGGGGGRACAPCRPVNVARAPPCRTCCSPGSMLGVPDTHFGDSTGPLKELALLAWGLLLLLGAGRSPACAQSAADIALERAIEPGDAPAPAPRWPPCRAQPAAGLWRTPLMQAVDGRMARWWKLCSRLVPTRISPMQEGLAPLTLACELGGQEVLEHLLAAHANPRAALPDGAGALHIARAMPPHRWWRVCWRWALRMPRQPRPDPADVGRRRGMRPASRCC
jgi:hypothetical protein